MRTHAATHASTRLATGQAKPVAIPAMSLSLSLVGQSVEYKTALEYTVLHLTFDDI